MTTPAEALKKAIEAHQAIADASRQAAAEVAAEREKARQQQAAATALKAPPAAG